MSPAAAALSPPSRDSESCIGGSKCILTRALRLPAPGPRRPNWGGGGGAACPGNTNKNITQVCNRMLLHKRSGPPNRSILAKIIPFCCVSPPLHDPRGRQCGGARPHGADRRRPPLAARAVHDTAQPLLGCLATGSRLRWGGTDLTDSDTPESCPGQRAWAYATEPSERPDSRNPARPRPLVPPRLPPVPRPRDGQSSGGGNTYKFIECKDPRAHARARASLGPAGTTGSGPRGYGVMPRSPCGEASGPA